VTGQDHEKIPHAASTKDTATAANKFNNIQQVSKYRGTASSPLVGKFVFFVSIQQHTMHSDTTGALKVFDKVIANMKDITGFDRFVRRQKGLSFVHGGHENTGIGLLQFQILAKALKLQLVMGQSKHW
jgi:hypothetical protein